MLSFMEKFLKISPSSPCIHCHSSAFALKANWFKKLQIEINTLLSAWEFHIAGLFLRSCFCVQFRELLRGFFFSFLFFSGRWVRFRDEEEWLSARSSRSFLPKHFHWGQDNWVTFLKHWTREEKMLRCTKKHFRKFDSHFPLKLSVVNQPRCVWCQTSSWVLHWSLVMETRDQRWALGLGAHWNRFCAGDWKAVSSNCRAYIEPILSKTLHLREKHLPNV